MRFVRSLTALLAATPMAAAAAQSGPPNDRPALVVLVAIDQMRPDYFDRYHDQFRGGFRLVRDSAAFFPNGHQEHAMTETAPGHSTMLSGREPVHTGIFSNDRGVPDPAYPVIGAPGVLGASPRRFVGTTLYDWMRVADSSTRVLAVSRKDRGAILPVGAAHADVYWFANGRFTTSRYYADTLPSWVATFDAAIDATQLPQQWSLLLPATAYAEPDSMPWENGGSDFTFPHNFPAAAAERLRRLEDSPWMDSLTLAFALRGADVLQLGRRGTTDLLVISLSTTDKVGHSFGPDSREMHDHLLRLDRWLGTFLDSLSARVPRRRTLLALTSDHGMASYPEYVMAVQHRPAGRMSLAGRVRHENERLRARYGTDFHLAFDNGILTGDVGAMQARGLNVDSIAVAFAGEIRSLPGVAKVFTPTQLAAAPPTDPDAERWKRNLPPEVEWLVVAVAKPAYVFSDKLTGEHGTMLPETVRVPIAFMGPGVHPGTYARVVRTVDIAPTLAVLLGVRPTERLDGVPIPEVLNGSAPTP